MSAEVNSNELKGTDYAALVRIASELDEKGCTKEADMIDQVLQTVVAAVESEEIKAGAAKAMRTLSKALISFCNKNFDTRGPKKFEIREIERDAHDLLNKIKELIGDGE